MIVFSVVLLYVVYKIFFGIVFYHLNFLFIHLEADMAYLQFIYLKIRSTLLVATVLLQLCSSKLFVGNYIINCMHCIYVILMTCEI